MDVVGRATQEAKAEDEGRFLRCLALTPALSRREREKNGTHYLATGSVEQSSIRRRA
jgi:hypothetical protein